MPSDRARDHLKARGADPLAGPVCATPSREGLHVSNILASNLPVNPVTANNVTEMCEFCGFPLPPYSGKVRRPRFHTDCSQVSRTLDYLTRQLETSRLTPESRTRLRKHLFYIANQCIPPLRDDLGRFATVRLEGGAA